MGFPLPQYQPHGFPRVRILKGQSILTPEKTATDKLKIVIAQDVTRQPAAQANRAVTHLKGIRLALMKNVWISIRSIPWKDSEKAT